MVIAPYGAATALRGQVRYDTERAKDVLAATLNKTRPWTKVVANA